MIISRFYNCEMFGRGVPYILRLSYFFPSLSTASLVHFIAVRSISFNLHMHTCRTYVCMYVRVCIPVCALAIDTKNKQGNEETTSAEGRRETSLV